MILKFRSALILGEPFLFKILAKKRVTIFLAHQNVVQFLGRFFSIFVFFFRF